MGLFSGDKPDVAVLLSEKAALLVEVEMLRERLAEKKEDIAALRAQLQHTQDALIAKEAPEAYRDRKDLEAGDDREMTEEEREHRRKQLEKVEIVSQYINEMENPQMFKDGDDMIQMLTRAVGTPVFDSPSLHGNEES